MIYGRSGFKPTMDSFKILKKSYGNVKQSYHKRRCPTAKYYRTMETARSISSLSSNSVAQKRRLSFNSG